MSLDDPPPPDPQKPPIQPLSDIKDENIGILGKIVGSGCVAFCTCTLGIGFLFIPFLGLFGLILVAIGCYAAYYSWKAADEGSKW